MNGDEGDIVTKSLVEGAADARARVAEDVEQLAKQLTVPKIKARAVDAAEQSLHSVGAHFSEVLAKVPNSVARYVRQHPAVGIALVIGAAGLIWRIAARQRRPAY